MATLKDYRNERLRKLDELKTKGIDPYPAKAHRSHELGAITADFATLENTDVSVVGRVTAIRKFGKIAFIAVRDASGSLQLFLRADNVSPLDVAAGTIGFAELPLLDTGDFIEAAGPVIKTKTGEVSVDVQRLRLLTKALRPLPTSFDGLKDKEERLRRRYVDTAINEEVRQRFIRRSRFWQAAREFLLAEGFIEINVPVLEHTTGGADANPFVTHMDALDEEFYLRISHELPLKRLIGGGYEKVFDIGPRFRNENYSDEHLPEHVAMEWYWAYANWDLGMELTQRMLRCIADATWGTRQFTLANGMTVDFGKDGTDWPRVSFVEVIRDRYGIDVFNCTLTEVQAKIKEHKIELEKGDNVGRCIDKLWKKVRVELAGPAFLVDIPTFLQPLAKLQAADGRLTEQFNLLLGGTEACKAYSELNDPVDQLNRFLEQQQLRDAGDDEAMMLDIDFVEMLEYGMPPACGYGHSERLFWILEGVTAREGVPFPQLRRSVDDVTRGIYPEVFKAEG
ncbi:lysine--tRNA ligase [Candidatus Saccharibacteria bacterium]|nr:lysine--tRNA ligase [Candidatus Saccharibacteria bacterium]